LPEDEDRVLERGPQRQGPALHGGAELVGARREIRRGELVLEGAAQLEADVRRDPFEGRLDLEEAVPLGAERLVLRRDVRRLHGEELALEALAEEHAGAGAQVAGEGARVGAQHAEDQIDAAGGAARGVGGVAGAVLDEGQVAEHPEDGEEREGDDAPPLLAGYAPHQLQDVGVRDAIELGAELEGDERVEVARREDLALGRPHQGEEEAERDAR
jgi:hypothetical protein